MTDTYEGRLQRDIENVCEMAKDDINAALWHFGVNRQAAVDEIRMAIANLSTAISLIQEGQHD